ncbi:MULTISPECIES: hypothetical protein [Bradyrhizobium]|nr:MULTISPECIES: hypothetical protein [Bradyrhizobium]MCS3727305.1 hypothetical protein [Bradyrhizobium betae]
MERIQKQHRGREAEAAEVARAEEMRRVVEDYANDLREIVRRLQRRLLN